MAGPRRSLIAFAVAAALAPMSVSARRQTFTSRIEAVRVDVLVTDNGKPVQGLSPSDFEVLDNGVRQRVDLASFEQIPLNVVLALDNSASLQGLRLGHLQTAGKRVLEGLEAGRSRGARRIQPRRIAEPGSDRRPRSRPRRARSGTWRGAHVARRCDPHGHAPRRIGCGPLAADRLQRRRGHVQLADPRGRRRNSPPRRRRGVWRRSRRASASAFFAI